MQKSMSEPKIIFLLPSSYMIDAADQSTCVGGRVKLLSVKKKRRKRTDLTYRCHNFAVASLRSFEAFKRKYSRLRRKEIRKEKRRPSLVSIDPEFGLHLFHIRDFQQWIEPSHSDKNGTAIRDADSWAGASQRALWLLCIMSRASHLPPLWRGRYTTADNGRSPPLEWFSPSCDSSASIVYNHPGISIDLPFFTKSSSFN